MLNRLSVVLPPEDEQVCCAAILDAHDAHIRTEEAYRDKLKLLRKGLMDDLLTGRVRVAAAMEAVS
jgi:type I restriction enzyme S subunit